MKNENWYCKRKLTIIFLAAVTLVFFAATAFGAIGNVYLENNLRVYPGLYADGKTQPVIPLTAAEWVQEEVFIEAPIDFDEDGERDLLCFQYGIPAKAVSSDNANTPLLLCPTIMTVSPYAGGTAPASFYSAYDYSYMQPRVDGPWPGEDNPDTTHYTYKDVEDTRKVYKDVVAANYNPDWIPPMRTTMFEERRGTYRGTTAPNRTSAWFSFFRSRGYAYGTLFMIGSSRAEGFCSNKPHDESIAAAAVVDWLNGRVKAYRYPYKVREATANEIATLQSWSNNLDNNSAGNRILDGKYIRDDVNGGWVECKAYWATGDAAMSGTSYDGALPLMAMTTGVEGLRCIIPFASVSSSFEYYRDNGTVIAPGAYQGEDIPMYFAYCGARMAVASALTNPTRYVGKYDLLWDNFNRLADEAKERVERHTGNYNSYYDTRNQAKYAKYARDGGVVILWHGLNDLNVKFKNASLWYETWKRVPGITAKYLFNLGKHGAPFQIEGFQFFPRIHGVLDKLMYGIDNTALEDWPKVIIHNNETLAFDEFESWPINDRVKKFYPTGDRVGAMSINKPRNIETLDFVDVKALTLTRPNVSATSAPQMAAAQYTTWKHNIIGGSDTALTNANVFTNIRANNDRLMYIMDIKENTRISGHIKVTAKAAADRKVGGISAMLVDLGAGYHVHQTFTSVGTMGGTANTGTTVTYYPGTTVALTRQNKNTTQYPWNIIARGSVSVQKVNPSGKTSVDCPETNFVPPFYYQTTVIEPGTFYPYTWETNVVDYTIPAGHKLGLIFFGTDPEYTQRPLVNPTKITVEIGPDTYLSLPLAGKFATDEILDPTGTIDNVAQDKTNGNVVIAIADEIMKDGTEVVFTFFDTQTLECIELPVKVSDGLLPGTFKAVFTYAEFAEAGFVPGTKYTAFSYNNDVEDILGYGPIEFVFDNPVIKVTPSAEVIKLNGNKNTLIITVVEVYAGGEVATLVKQFSIDNNAADTYVVAPYKVYVDTKGNTQIRECYIKEVLESGSPSGGPSAEPIVTPSARVEKLSGNTNNLFITVKEVPSAGAPVVFEAKFSISNNASGTYKVGPYNVYVATKGNDKIEQCYIK